MRTVPLRGKSAAGRVVLVDDEDYELVSRYKWYVREAKRPGRRRPHGPYAFTAVSVGGGRQKTILMHVMIMGRPFIDHANHDGLDNRRENLRPATRSQNNQNQLPKEGGTSRYKGVHLSGHSGLWHAEIKLNGRKRSLGRYTSELEAAYAYDAAAREMFGQFACPNFPDEPTAAMREQWRIEAEARRAAIADKTRKATAAGRDAWLSQRQPDVNVCVICGNEYQSMSQRQSYYCSNACACQGYQRRRRERQREREREGRLF